MSCTKNLPINKPVPVCDLPFVSEFPQMLGKISEDGQLVLLQADSVRMLYIWVKAEDARLKKAELCLANRS